MNAKEGEDKYQWWARTSCSHEEYSLFWKQTGPFGASGHLSISVPHFLFLGNKLQPPWPSLSSKEQLLIRKGGDAETGEEQSRDNSAALGQGPGFSSRDTHNNNFEPFCRTKTPNKWKNYLMKHSSFQEGGGPLHQLWETMQTCLYPDLIYSPISTPQSTKSPPNPFQEGHSL